MTAIAIFVCLIPVIPLMGYARDKLTPDDADAKSSAITGGKIAAIEALFNAFESEKDELRVISAFKVLVAVFEKNFNS